MAGVMLADLGAHGVPSVSLRVGVPHYLLNAEHPQAVAALQTHLAHVLNVPPPDDDGELAGEIHRWRTLHDEVVANDAQLQLYVRMLEHRARPPRGSVDPVRRRHRRPVRAVPARPAREGLRSDRVP